MSIPGAANPLLLATAAAGGYTISRSLRFSSIDSAYLSRTPASAGNRKTWTWAGWVKRTGLDGTRYLFDDNGVTSTSLFIFSDKIYVQLNGLSGRCVTNAVFRDPSAWFHIVWAVDTTQSTAANRNRLYVNGVEQTFSSAAYPSQNTDTGINAASLHQIGYSFDGYLADVHLIDSQALDPSSFTEVSATTGQLIPKQYTGSFGTNGFWLKFSDNSAATATTLGKDYSGNNNNFTPNNLSVTAGAGNDSLVDTPTSAGTDTGLGGEVTGNYCTFNPLNNPPTSATLANGNLEVTANTTLFQAVTGTIFASSGKWYAEFLMQTTATDQVVGIAANTFVPSTANNRYLGRTADSYGFYSDGRKIYNNTLTSYGTSWSVGDILQIAMDLDNGKVWLGKNGTWQASGDPAAGTNAAFTGISGSYTFACSPYGSGKFFFNAGQRPFAYTAPSGFKALCDTNLPAPVVAKSSDYFQTVLYTGNGSTQTISGLGFSPDFLWFKARSIAYSHALYDTVRGYTKSLVSNSTVAEGTEAGGLSAFNSDGFSLNGENTVYGSTNTNGQTYVAWTWDAGSSTVTNTQGSITSQVRANASAGFSIVTYSAGASGSTVGHGLGVAPGLIIVKGRTNTVGWVCYHQSLGKDKFIYLNLTNAEASSSNYWGSSGPNSTTFGLSANGNDNNLGDMVAYCFSPVAGYSSFGSYVGNGSASDGPFVYTGFRPRFLLIKGSSVANTDWAIIDTARDTYNIATDYLAANSSGAEQTLNLLDVVSNGFKIKAYTDSTNQNNQTYVWAAWAESPFQYARAR